MLPGSAICLSNAARPEVRPPRPGYAAAACAAPRAWGPRGQPGRGRLAGGRFPVLLRAPGPFNKSFNPKKSLHTFAHFDPELQGGVMGSVHLAQAIQPPAEGVASAHELSCVGWKVKVMPQQGCLIQRTCNPRKSFPNEWNGFSHVDAAHVSTKLRINQDCCARIT